MVTEQHALPPFRQIVIGGFADVTLVQGDSESLTAEAARSQLRRFEVRVRDGTLTIRPNHDGKGWFSFFGLDARAARVTIAFRTLDRITADGAVKIRAERMRVDRLVVSASGATSVRIAELDAKALAVDGSGAIKMEVAGRTAAQTIEISGAGDYRAEDLASDTAKVTVSGAGRVVLRVAKTLDVDLSGAASVDYIGDPKVTRRVSGMGRIKQRDAMSTPQWTRNVAASGIDSGLNRSGAGRALGTVGVHARERPDVGHAAIAQERDEHADDVLRAIERIERAAEAFRVLRLERRREREPELAAAGGIRRAVRADDRRRLAHRRRGTCGWRCSRRSARRPLAARHAPPAPRAGGAAAARGSASTETSGTDELRDELAREGGAPRTYPGIGR